MSRTLLFLCSAAVVVAVHLATDPASEPFFYNDETRHVMTGVFVRDAIADLPDSIADPKGYALRYYAQYPALGLLTWPPLFYLVEGTAMFGLGDSFVIARALVGLFALLAGWYTFRLVCRTHGPWPAMLVVMLVGFAPVVYEHSRRVMLELPTMAFVLAAVFHFERYLAEPRPRDAVIACLFAACAALTRFDGVVLLPLFLFRLASTGRFGVLLRAPVVVGILIALALTLPYYLFTWHNYAAGLTKAAVDGAADGSTSVLTLRHLLYYPATLPVQVGWPLTAAAALGGVVALLRRRERSLGVYFALWLATYTLFAPMAELDSRHAIYWVPSIGVFATEAVLWLARFRLTAGIVAAVALVTGTAWDAATRPAWWLTGYDAAARYVVEHSSGDRPILMDGLLNGSFIYHTRRADLDRRLWILRGDKLFYSMFSEPNMACTELATSEAEVLELLHRYDPEFIVVEQPQLVYRVRAAELLREVLRTHPERFRLEFTSPIHSNHRNHFADACLEVYRKLDRNPNPTTSVEIPVFGLGGSLKATK